MSEAGDGQADSRTPPDKAAAPPGQETERPRKKRSRRSRRRPATATTGDGVGHGRRRQGRVLALQILYEVDLTDHGLAETLERTLADEDELSRVLAEDEEIPLDQAAVANTRALREHVEQLVTGAFAARAETDRLIEAAAPAYPIGRVPAIDRNVLRLAVYELLHEARVPSKVAINEAVELAKRFGGDSSGRFVNGVLGTIVDQLPTAPAPAGEPETPDGATPFGESV